jgi:hypothetical protein
MAHPQTSNAVAKANGVKFGREPKLTQHQSPRPKGATAWTAKRCARLQLRSQRSDDSEALISLDFGSTCFIFF